MDGTFVFAESLLLLCSGEPKLSLTSNDASRFATNRVASVAVGPGGLNLTPYARTIC